MEGNSDFTAQSSLLDVFHHYASRVVPLAVTKTPPIRND